MKSAYRNLWIGYPLIGIRSPSAICIPSQPSIPQDLYCYDGVIFRKIMELSKHKNKTVNSVNHYRRLLLLYIEAVILSVN